ncbi:hypothetical protein [Glycomyces buryatensis]|uniref:ASCH domain-containing protein n=1 Tax=Glycomyces buryatensis TaxID=2570927 RepID=A0A4S8Q8H7_9ACTN|nr:hypothetical protein [Glycomyces buryatensis]THV40578.1 hypothetical protein FAB82_15030 [Glycomyces buryatensis]
MRAFTVRPPWPDLIARGGKTIENRVRRTNYTGPVAVHAGKTLAVAEWEWARKTFGPILIPRKDNLVLGAVVAVADLVDCHAAGWPSACNTAACKSWGEMGGDIWHWVLADVRPLAEPVPARGQLGLWTPDPDLTAAIEAALDCKE